jgi:hypothetical protein
VTKKKYFIHVFIVAVLLWIPSLSAQPATKDEAVNLSFTGVYRADAKTSIARKGQKTAPLEQYDSLAALLATLRKDSPLRSKYPILEPGHIKAPSTRFPEEQRNVRIKDCWLIAVNYEKSHLVKSKSGKMKRTGDNDFHLVVSSSPQFVNAQKMNMEVSGLPAIAGTEANKLRKVRRDFLSMCAKMPPAGRFIPFSSPIHARIEGSLFFDGQHNAAQIAPAYHLVTTWEIHPIYRITRLD